MPKIFEDSGFVFRFYSADLDEPIHVHVEGDGREAKFWIEPITCASDGGFRNKDLRRIERIIANRFDEIVDKWRTMEERRRNAGRNR